MVKSTPTKKERLLLLAGEMAVLGAAVVIVLVFLASTLDGYLIQKGQGAAVISAMIASLTNTDREVNKVGVLTVSPTLTAIAQLKANDMAQKGYFAHTSPEGKSPWYWFKQGGYVFSYAGENLAIDFSDSADVERAWMNSPTHRANILNNNFTEIGIATAVGTYEGRQTTFVVQEFGTPARAETAQVKDVTANPKPTEIALATTVTKPVIPAAPVPTKKSTAVKPSPASATGTPTLAVASPDSAVLGSSAEGLSAPVPDRVRLNAIRDIFTASPRTTLRYAYYLFALLILIALIIETGIEFKRHHMRHMLLVVALMLLMGGLFLIADTAIFTDPIVAEGGAASLSL